MLQINTHLLRRLICRSKLLLILFICAPASAEMATVAILRTAPPYALEIEEGLKQGLSELGYVKGENIRYFPTHIVPDEVARYTDTEQQVRSLVAAGVDVIATIGTQASTPAWSILQNTAIPMVFSGVTYPVSERLIEAFGKPTGKPITGISYAAPARKRIEVIRSMFPDKNSFKRLAFVYSSQVPQELSYVNNLKELAEVAGFEFIFIDFFDRSRNAANLNMLIDQLRQANPHIVYGWYSLDQLGSQKTNAYKLFAAVRKPILGLTSDFTDFGAIGGVMSDHAALGHQQARIIHEILKGEPAGNIPPLEPSAYRMEINLRAAQRLGIAFSPEILKRADRVVK